MKLMYQKSPRMPAGTSNFISSLFSCFFYTMCQDHLQSSLCRTFSELVHFLYINAGINPLKESSINAEPHWTFHFVQSFL